MRIKSGEYSSISRFSGDFRLLIENSVSYFSKKVSGCRQNPVIPQTHLYFRRSISRSLPPSLAPQLYPTLLTIHIVLLLHPSPLTPLLVPQLLPSLLTPPLVPQLHTTTPLFIAKLSRFIITLWPR